MSNVHDKQNNRTSRFNKDTFNIITFDTVTSTQDVARAAITAQLDGTPLPESIPAITGNTVIRAAAQQSGRGRRARDWHSALGGSYQTLLFAPPLARKPAVSLWVAVGIARALSKASNDSNDSNAQPNAQPNARTGKQPIHVMVKWPNDLYINGKKVAGMLCEWCRGWLLVGVGVNVINSVPETAAQLNLPLEHVHTSVITGAAAGVRDWQHADLLLAETFAEWDFLASRQVTVQTGQDTLTGVARGVNEQGCLLLDEPCCDGHVLHWSDHQSNH